MTNKDLIRQYVSTTGLPIPEYQFNKLNNNLKTSYLRKRLQAAQNSSNHYLKEYEIFALPEDIKRNYINGLSDDNIHLLIQKSLKPKELYDELSQYIGLQLTDGEFVHLLLFGVNTDEIAEIMIDYYDGDLTPEQMTRIVMNVSHTFKIVNLIEEKQPLEFTEKMDDLVRLAVNPDETYSIIINNQKENLHYTTIFLILLYTKKPLYFDKLIRQYVNYEISDGQEAILLGRGKNIKELIQLLSPEN
jgi:hypothetical protein